MSLLQSVSMAVRICKGDEQRLQSRPQDYIIMLPARRVQVDGLLHAGRSGVACLSVQNISETDAVEILVTGEDGEGDVYNKHLAAAGATKGLGTDMDLTRYSQYNIYIRALDDGTPDVLLTEGLWDRAELSRQP